jgi:protein-S-isoprenylcysteine O-methyltransferase Ste14
VREFLLGFSAIMAYGGFHSVLAALNIKAWFVDIFGWRAYEGLYRLFFNAVAVVTLLPVFAVVAVNPGKTLWQADAPISYILLILQAIGGIGLVISLLQIDTLRFLGLSQYAAWSNGKPLPLPDEPLQTGGVYALVRHPLYFFSLLAIWPSPIMTTSTLGLLVGITLYFAVGSLLEEQKLRKTFGQPYADYQKRVAWLIPLVKIGPRPAINVGDYLQE